MELEGFKLKSIVMNILSLAANWAVQETLNLKG